MKYTFKVSPNYRTPLSTQQIMLELTLGILVVLSYNVYFYFTKVGTNYGFHAAYMILTSVAVAVLTEVVWALAFKKDVVKQLTSSFPWVTALLFVSMLTVSKPLYAVAIGSFVAIFIGKLIFGGFGHNIFNPAGVGRIFTELSFGGLVVTAFPDVVTGATPNTIMERLGWVIQDPTKVTAYLDQFGGLWHLFTGNYLGALGETNTLLILLVGIYLAIRGVLDWKVPAVFLSSIFVFAGIIALVQGMGWWYPVFHLFTGGVMFGAIFMLTDPVTSPTSITGRVIFAIGTALLVIVLRVKSNLPEGVIRSILFMNMMTPLIDQVTDGWQFKDVKKNLMKIGGVVLTSVATIVLIANLIHYIEPAKVVIPEMVIVLGDPLKIMDTVTEDMTEIVSRTDEGDIATFVISSKGYAVLYDEYAEDPKPNIFEIKINTVTKTVVNATYLTFSDTFKIGDKTNSEIFFNQFLNLDITNPDATIDTVTGSTYSSESSIRALKAAILALGQ